MHLSKAIHTKLYCAVCEIFLASKANYAFHVLTMEHRENFTKVGKPKSAKNEGTSSDWEVSEATPTTGADKLYPKIEDLKEMDCVRYDRFWRSFAETIDEQIFPASEVNNTNLTTVPSFCKSITQSLISCEVCNVVLTKIADYEDHVTSQRHIWNMKLRGTGVSVHCGKTNTNPCKTNAVELSTNNHQMEQNDLIEIIPACESLTFIPFPLLYCDACELLLNTLQQFNTHVNGESHKLSVKKKGKMKVKTIQLPIPNKYYCFSCKMVLNSCLQYNEHKYGKKHKIKCKQLAEIGITIPPEEQLPEWNMPKVNPEKPVCYPEFYEEFVLIKREGEPRKCSKLKELLMNEDDYGSDDFIKTSDTTSPMIFSELQNLNTLRSKAILQHIYRIQNKNLKTISTPS